MARVLLPLPARDFDPSEAAVSWRVLARPEDFRDVPKTDPDYRRKVSGLERDSFDNPTPAFVVHDRNYVSARWPGDVHTFARRFAGMLRS